MCSFYPRISSKLYMLWAPQNLDLPVGLFCFVLFCPFLPQSSYSNSLLSDLEASFMLPVYAAIFSHSMVWLLSSSMVIVGLIVYLTQPTMSSLTAGAMLNEQLKKWTGFFCEKIYLYFVMKYYLGGFLLVFLCCMFLCFFIYNWKEMTNG